MSSPALSGPHRLYNFRGPAEQEMGISLAHATQRPINALHLAQTQIAFFHCLPVHHTSFSETLQRAVCLEGILGCVNSRDYQHKHVSVRLFVCVLWQWEISRHIGSIGSCEADLLLCEPSIL